MRLNLGDNIRKLRRQENLTQEQFAEKLGVSPQAVSRWENGTTYPDMELIPVIAKEFHTTTDVLFDISNSKREENARETMQELYSLMSNKEPDKPKILELIRTIRLHYVDTDCIWMLWAADLNVYRDPAILPEVRATFHAIMESNTSYENKTRSIDSFLLVEDEELIDDFLKEYATDKDMSKRALLYRRYTMFGQMDKADPYRQMKLFYNVDSLIGNSPLWRMKDDNEHYPAAIDFSVALLTYLSGPDADPKHPISGNGEVDIWVGHRLWLGFCKAGYLAMDNKSEEAFAILEDTVSLLEKCMAITDTTLGISSPWLKDISCHAKEKYSIRKNNIVELSDNTGERVIMIRDEEMTHSYLVSASSWYSFMVGETTDNRSELFAGNLAPLRGDERFKAMAERVRRLVVHR